MKLASPTPRQITGAAIAAAIALLLPLLVPVPQHLPWEAIPGFYAIYGVVGCGALVVFTKWLGRVLLIRPEGWYRDDVDRDEERA